MYRITLLRSRDAEKLTPAIGCAEEPLPEVGVAIITVRLIILLVSAHVQEAP